MTLNTAIKSWQIQPATISGGHLAVSNSVSGTQVLSYDSSEDSFKWDYLATVTINEVPSGDIDGFNKEFTLANTPLEDSERVYLNGLLQEPGSGKDYTIDGNKITFATAPESGDVVLVSYLILKAQINTYSYGYAAGGDAGGANYFSTVDRIQFPFDSGTASHVGNLVGSRGHCGAGSNSTQYGYVMDGRQYDGTILSNVERIAFPFDSGTASNCGTLNHGRVDAGGVNNSTYAYCCGGAISAAISYIDRFQFPFDSGTASTVGNLHYTGDYVGNFNASNYGYVFGASSIISYIDRFVFPFDSGTAIHAGNLSSNRGYLGGCNSSTHGYAVGGYDSGPVSIIDRVVFPFDSGTAVHVGNLSTANEPEAVNSTVYGYSIGGWNWGYMSNIDRYQFPFDSGTTTHVGNLSYSAVYAVGIDTTDFVSMFV